MVDLVEEYVGHIIAMNSTDYGNKLSVVLHNKHAKRIRKIAMIINQHHPELKNPFFSLLRNKNKNVKLWAAHHILEVMNFNKDEQESAVAIIRQNAQEDSVYGLGDRMWLKDWLENHKRE